MLVKFINGWFAPSDIMPLAALPRENQYDTQRYIFQLSGTRYRKGQVVDLPPEVVELIPEKIYVLLEKTPVSYEEPGPQNMQDLPNPRAISQEMIEKKTAKGEEMADRMAKVRAARKR